MEFVSRNFQKAIKAMADYVPIIKELCEQYYREKNFEKLSEKFKEFI